jgi:uncharacterized membrane protein
MSMATKTIYKVISWRALSISLTYLVTYLLTGSLKEATGFTIVLHIVLLIANYLFEVIWENYVSKKH